MNKDELLEPRWIVTALWPNTEFKVGDIIYTKYYEKAANDLYSEYPHLFRKLAWWEHREVKDMPEYVKYQEDGVVRKVDHFDLETTSAWFMFLEGDTHPYSPGGSALINTGWIPADKSEYQPA